MCLLLYLHTTDVSAQSSFQTKPRLFQVHCHTTSAAHSWSGQSCNSKVVVYADTVKINPSLVQNKFHRSECTPVVMAESTLGTSAAPLP